jgi:ubiquinone/menaquinone biosynthesis C-methylase UbiE
VESCVQPSDEILDVGAGTGQLSSYAFKGEVKQMVGVDLDPRVTDNPLLDQGVVADVYQLPFESNRFDLAFAIYVLEHIREPDRLVREISRVLRPGGMFFALTPNRHHYVSLIAALTPTRFHRWYNRKRGRAEEDTFPTYYRMNSRRTLRRQFGQVSFHAVHLSTIEVQPNYLTFCTPAFLLGAAYERLVNSTEWLSFARVNIIAIFRKEDKDNLARLRRAA